MTGTRVARRFRFDRRPALDWWILLRLDGLVVDVTGGLDQYEISASARAIEAFIDDLTNWYIRRSRDRFWAPVGAAAEDKESAYQTLYEVLTTSTLLIAPITPFLAETLYQRLVRTQSDDAAESVHLVDWPDPSAERSDDTIEQGIDSVLQIVRLARAARNSHDLKTRQPLASVTVVTRDGCLQSVVRPFEHLLLEELNVKSVLWADDPAEYVHHEVRPNYKVCGPRFGKRMQRLKKVLEQSDGDQLSLALTSQGRHPTRPRRRTRRTAGA